MPGLFLCGLKTRMVSSKSGQGELPTETRHEQTKKPASSIEETGSKIGAGKEIRTLDPLVGNEMLYH